MQINYTYTVTERSDTMYYVHQDRLGNYDVLTNDTGTVIERLSYDVWGNRVLWNDWTQRMGYDSEDTTHIFRRGFTQHEHLGAHGIINMNGRMFDPNTASFFSPDPYVYSPYCTQSFNRYSYCLNNPLMYTDPSGEFWQIAAALYVTFFTDFGYEMQKKVSPVAVKIDFKPFGEQRGIGIDVSVGIPTMFPVSYRVHAGASYYWHWKDLMGNDLSGWETRYGAEWSLFGGLYKYGGTTYWSKWSGTQTLNYHQLMIGGLQAKYINDMPPVDGWYGKIFGNIPGVPHGDGDRYRTAAARIGLGGVIEAGINLMTGDPGPPGGRRTDYFDGRESYVEHGQFNPNSHRIGLGYFRIGPLTFGRNSEYHRNAMQNRWVHRNSIPWFEVLSIKPRWFWQFGGPLW